MKLEAFSGFGITLQDNLTILIDLDHNGFGCPTPPVVDAVRHLCGLLLPGDELQPLNADTYYQVAREYYDRIAREDATDRQLLIFLAYVSGYFHELRHAHDLLASTYGQGFLFQRLILYQNTPALLGALADWQSENPEGSIPIPIGAGLDQLRGLSIFDELSELLNRDANLRSSIALFNRPSHARHTHMTARHLLEACAIDVQLDFIHDLFGEEAVSKFLGFVQQGQKADVYLQIRNDVVQEFIASGYRGSGLGGVINLLIWCSLMGTVGRDGKLSNSPAPSVLFEAILEHVLRAGGSFAMAEIHAALKSFYSEWGILSPSEMINFMKSRLADQLEMFARALEESPTPAGINRRFLDAYEYFTRGFSDMARLTQMDPNPYFAGRTYAWGVLTGMLPSIHIKVRLNGTANEFMSTGTAAIPYESWNFITFMSTIFSMLIKGRGVAPSPFYEDICYDELVTTGWNKIPFRFHDTSALFSHTGSN